MWVDLGRSAHNPPLTPTHHQPQPNKQIPEICKQLLPANGTDLFVARACPPALGCYSLGAALYEIDPEAKEAGTGLAKVWLRLVGLVWLFGFVVSDPPRIDPSHPHTTTKPNTMNERNR